MGDVQVTVWKWTLIDYGKTAHWWLGIGTGPPADATFGATSVWPTRKTLSAANALLRSPSTCHVRTSRTGAWPGVESGALSPTSTAVLRPRRVSSVADTVLICETETRCERHDRPLHGYPCSACHEAWRERHPKTVAAIALMHKPNVSYAKALAAYKAAAKAEAEPRYSPVPTEGGDRG